MRASLVLLACLAGASLALSPAAGHAATLRPFGTLAGPQVAVSDIWDNAGSVAGRVLGPSPSPGERIVVEAAQLAAIARQFEVDWRPDSPNLRTILERPGVPLPRELVSRALEAALQRAGAPDGDLDMPDFAPPLVAPEAATMVGVEQLSWEPASAKFVARLAVTGPAMTTLRLVVAGRVVEMADAVVAARRLPVGTLLRARDLLAARVPRERLRDAPLLEMPQPGMLVRRTLAAGEALAELDLGPPLAVIKGARVVIAISSFGMALSATGEALQAGAVGERIEVRNPASRAVLLAEITGPGAVRVEPGSAPVRPPANSPGVGN